MPRTPRPPRRPRHPLVRVNRRSADHRADHRADRSRVTSRARKWVARWADRWGERVAALTPRAPLSSPQRPSSRRRAQVASLPTPHRLLAPARIGAGNIGGREAARTAYQAALKSALDAYTAATAPARATYNAAIAPAQAQLSAALDAAEKVYTAEIAAAKAAVAPVTPSVNPSGTSTTLGGSTSLKRA